MPMTFPTAQLRSASPVTAAAFPCRSCWSLSVQLAVLVALLLPTFRPCPPELPRRDVREQLAADRRSPTTWRVQNDPKPDVAGSCGGSSSAAWPRAPTADRSSTARSKAPSPPACSSCPHPPAPARAAGDRRDWKLPGGRGSTGGRAGGSSGGGPPPEPPHGPAPALPPRSEHRHRAAGPGPGFATESAPGRLPAFDRRLHQRRRATSTSTTSFWISPSTPTAASPLPSRARTGATCPTTCSTRTASCSSATSPRATIRGPGPISAPSSCPPNRPEPRAAVAASERRLRFARQQRRNPRRREPPRP